MRGVLSHSLLSLPVSLLLIAIVATLLPRFILIPGVFYLFHLENALFWGIVITIFFFIPN
jgi:hypothetical protein